MSLESIVNVVISRQTKGVTQVGFGTPLILGLHTRYLDSAFFRVYEDMDGVAADFQTSDAEYKAANSAFAQNPHPEKVVIGRRTAEVAQVATVTPNVVTQAIQHYIETINGVAYDFTSDASPSASEVVAGLSALINADTNCPAAATGSTTLILTAKVTGTGFSHAESVNLVAVDTTPNHGVVEDLQRIQDVNDDWYAIMLTSRNLDDFKNAAGWTEAKLKVFFACDADPNALTTSALDFGSYIKTKALSRSLYFYSGDQADYPEAAWLGVVLPLAPGSETWKFKTLALITPDNLTETQKTNLKNKNANYYETIAGVNITSDGKVGSGEYIDIVRGIDWLQKRMEERIFATLINASKIPYTDPGVAILEGDVRAQLSEGEQVGLIAPDPAFTVVAGKVLDQQPADRTARKYKGLSFSARLAGAIHEIDINGVVTV